MMAKCEICKDEVGVTFLNKLDGTLIRINKNNVLKKYYICSSCQKKYKEELKKQLS